MKEEQGKREKQQKQQRRQYRTVWSIYVGMYTTPMLSDSHWELARPLSDTHHRLVTSYLICPTHVQPNPAEVSWWREIKYPDTKHSQLKLYVNPLTVDQTA